MLPDFSALTAKALHAGRCLTPLFTSATRGLMRALRGVRRKKANRGHGAVAARSRYLKKKPV
ncbi:hypothetical protein [Duganella callida]|uniref:Uncharacterized protein n=1 Tax=Duganella callida TaxID=2561932 RepID=A0A4Y9SXU5_9BURK|nr:hypothetical protein [Duganella callida]TFW29453.1 hypothetical protein E4L98_03730 [Duganella callida]